MHLALAAVVKNIKNAAVASIDNKNKTLPFTSKDLDDYYKFIDEPESKGCGLLHSHSPSIKFKIFAPKLSNCRDL